MRLNGIKRHLHLSAVLVILLGSCVSDHREIVLPGEEDALVKFSIRLPTAIKPQTRALDTTDENQVTEIDVLVFEPDGGAFVYSARADGGNITGSGNVKTFTVTLKQGDFDLAIVANARSVLDEASLEDMTKQNALATLTARMPAGGKWIADNTAAGYVPIPMWGEIGNKKIDDETDLTGANAIPLVRMVARVDVTIAVPESNFKLTSVNVYNYNSLGSVVPAPAQWSNTAVTSPTLPASASTTRGPLGYTGIDEATNSCQGEIYIFEAANLTGGTPKDLLDRTCLVIGGSYNGGTPTYYRVDFANDSGASPVFLDVLRNHQYIFNITEVSGPGFPTAEEAFNTLPVNIEADVVRWNRAGMTDTVFDGQYMLSVAPNEFTFYRESVYTERTDNVFYVETDYPGGWKVEKVIDVATGSPTIWAGATYDGETNISGGAANVNTKVVISLYTNIEAQRNAIIWIAAGRMRHAVRVTQTDISGSFTLTTNAAARYPLDGQSKVISVIGNYPWEITNVTDTYDILQNGSSLVGMTGLNNYITFTMAEQDPDVSKMGRTATITFTPQEGNGVAKIVTITADEDFYVGRFGGMLVKVGDVWQFERPLYVEKANEAEDVVWSTTSGATGVTDEMYGKGNTLTLYEMGPSVYTAASVCFRKNKNYAGIGNVSDPDYVWYLPAQNQLIAILLINDAYTGTGLSSTYWSSTEEDAATSWEIMLNSYGALSMAKTTTLNDIRCVRE